MSIAAPAATIQKFRPADPPARVHGAEAQEEEQPQNGVAALAQKTSRKDRRWQRQQAYRWKRQPAEQKKELWMPKNRR